MLGIVLLSLWVVVVGIGGCEFKVDFRLQYQTLGLISLMLLKAVN